VVLNTLLQLLTRVLQRALDAVGEVENARLNEQLQDLETLVDDGPAALTEDELEAGGDPADPEEPDQLEQSFLSLLGELPEESQEVILEPLDAETVENPSDVREALQEAEGGAVAQAATFLAGNLGIEIAGLTQLESHQFVTSQVLTFLALEDVLGKELETTITEGVEPLLEQQINEEYRSKQADLADVVEQQLRSKDSDVGYLNDLARYGIKEEDVPVLEEAAISEVGPEELIETPAEAGVLPDEETLQAELDRAGISEDAKEVFLETVAQLPRTTRLYEEATTAEELVRQLDAQVQSGDAAGSHASPAGRRRRGTGRPP